MTAENTPKIYTLSPEGFAVLLEKLAKLNKRAAKLGVEPVGVKGVRRYTETVRVVRTERLDEDEELLGLASMQDAYDEERERVDFEVFGGAVKLNGWNFVARIDHLEGGNIMMACEGAPEIPVRYRDADCTCDHCGTRRYRRNSYLVVSDAGEWKQVGRNCLADFLGGRTPDGLAQWMEWTFDLPRLVSDSEEGSSSFVGEVPRSVEHVLEVTVAWIRTNGYRSSKAATGEP